MRLWPLQSASRRANTITALAMSVLLMLVSLPAFAQPAGPFAALQGSWSGAGTITMSNSTKERIRCNATHRLGGSSNDLVLELTCASDSYKFELQSQIAASGDTISGQWFEKTRATGGTIGGHIAGSQIQVRAEGQTFSAFLSVTTRGDRQAISIQSPGSEMSDVTITLTRKPR